MTRDNNEDRPSMVPSTMRVVFGIIMIIVYVGMGVLLLINYFQWNTPVLTWLRWIGGIMFILYGIWRGDTSVLGHRLVIMTRRRFAPASVGRILSPRFAV